MKASRQVPVQLVRPNQVTHEMLLDVHTEAYLQAVSSSNAKLTEVCPSGTLPSWPCRGQYAPASVACMAGQLLPDRRKRRPAPRASASIG